MTGKRKNGRRKLLETGRAPDSPPNLAGVPSMPAGLSVRAREEWERVVPLLAQRGDLSEVDQTLLGDYCRLVGRLEGVEGDIDVRGALIPGKRGSVKNPAVQLAREYRASLYKAIAELGFSPASRNRMTLPEQTLDEDPILDS